MSADGARTEAAGAWFVYMLECAGRRIYTGITPDVAARFEKHRRGRGAAYTRINKPLRVIAAMPCGSRSQAARAEYRLKQLRRPAKLVWAAQWPWAQKAQARARQRAVRHRCIQPTL